MTIPVNVPLSIDTLARTIWGEARGCGAAGMRHVASVILNRVAHPSWWGKDIQSVCLAPWQFSCRNQNDPNFAKLCSVTVADPAFALAVSIATDAIGGKLDDFTMGADSYYALSMKEPPAWAATAVKTAADGWHVFYRTVAEKTPQDVRNVAHVEPSPVATPAPTPSPTPTPTPGFFASLASAFRSAVGS